MANIISDKMITPELIQYKMTSKNIGKEINKLLNDDDHYNKVCADLLNVKNIFLNKKNAIKTAAKIINSLSNEKN